MRSRILLSTAMACLLAFPAFADTMAQPKGGAATGATLAKGETVDERISNLHDELQITSGEEKKWGAVADAMRENNADMEKMIKDKHAQSKEGMTAKDDLANYQAFAQAHVDGLKNLRSTFDSLYDSMPADQQKIADQVFQNSKH